MSKAINKRCYNIVYGFAKNVKTLQISLESRSEKCYSFAKNVSRLQINLESRSEKCYSFAKNVSTLQISLESRSEKCYGFAKIKTPYKKQRTTLQAECKYKIKFTGVKWF